MDTDLDFRAQLRDRGAYPVLLAAALVVVAFVGINLSAGGGEENSRAAVSVSPSPPPSAPPSGTPRPSPSPTSVMTPDEGYLAVGRNSLRIAGIAFSVDLPSGWESFGWGYRNYITKSIVGPQGAEAKLFWTSYPEQGDSAAACAYLRSQSLGPSAADLAAAVSEVPGTHVVAGPSDVTVGGLPAKHVVFSVREDVGCDPGFFFMYPNVWGGALWPETVPGDTIRVWIVDVGRTLFFIEGATHEDAGPELEKEVEQIVDSIAFE
jgi:hypothetical protein